MTWSPKAAITTGPLMIWCSFPIPSIYECISSGKNDQQKLKIEYVKPLSEEDILTKLNKNYG